MSRRIVLGNGNNDPMVLATMRDLGGVDLTAEQIAGAIGVRCRSEAPHRVDVLGRLAALRNKGNVYRQDGARRGGWCLAERYRR